MSKYFGLRLFHRLVLLPHARTLWPLLLTMLNPAPGATLPQLGKGAFGASGLGRSTRLPGTTLSSEPIGCGNMTTESAHVEYVLYHLREMAAKNVAVHNPNNMPLDMLPRIYGFNNGGSRQWLEAVLLSEDGVYLGSHICSDEAYMPHDLGVLEGTRPDRHETFRKHYPGGYVMQFVPYDDFNRCPGVLAAVEAAAERESAEAAQTRDAAMPVPFFDGPEVDFNSLNGVSDK